MHSEQPTMIRIFHELSSLEGEAAAGETFS